MLNSFFEIFYFSKKIIGQSSQYSFCLKEGAGGSVEGPLVYFQKVIPFGLGDFVPIGCFC